jgi:predicted O-methyltransferase YrrM
MSTSLPYLRVDETFHRSQLPAISRHGLLVWFCLRCSRNGRVRDWQPAACFMASAQTALELNAPARTTTLDAQHGDKPVKKLVRFIRKMLPPSFLARIDYLSRHHKAFFPFGGPMNGQTARLEVIREIIFDCAIARIVETGAFRGTTTEWFAQFGLPVGTVEIDPRFCHFAQRRLRRWEVVEVKLQDSVDYLRQLAARITNNAAPTLFYLDAHWRDHLPLRDEVEIIFAAFPLAIVAIDDFAIPDDPGYQFDDYGAGKALTLDYLSACKTPLLALYFPATPSRFETGQRRGCVIATASADLSRKLDHLPLLRRWSGAPQL